MQPVPFDTDLSRILDNPDLLRSRLFGNPDLDPAIVGTDRNEHGTLVLVYDEHKVLNHYLGESDKSAEENEEWNWAKKAMLYAKIEENLSELGAWAPLLYRS